MMKVAVLTTGRQDWGIIRSTCKGLQKESSIDLKIITGGMACSDKYGKTENSIRSEDFEIGYSMNWLHDQGTMSAETQAALSLEYTGKALDQTKPDCLLLIGDRFETAASALAATIKKIPIVHIGGGFETEGAFDNSFRHAITKMSSLHFVSNQENANRVLQMGEDPSSVKIVGSAGLDNLCRTDLADKKELEEFLGIELTHPLVIVTFHPATLCDMESELENKAMLDAFEEIDATYVITLPNTDPGSEEIRNQQINFCRTSTKAIAIKSLGERRYLGMMKISDLIVGNSSSAIIEAPLIGVPVINIGNRQKGRKKSANIIDTLPSKSSIVDAIKLALSDGFRSQAKTADSYYGDGKTGNRIVRILRDWVPPSPPVKKFHELNTI